MFVELRLAAGACAEQAQLWRVKPNGIPDTEHPLWVFDDGTDTDGPGNPDANARDAPLHARGASPDRGRAAYEA